MKNKALLTTLLVVTSLAAACNQASPVDVGAPEASVTSATASLDSQSGKPVFHARTNGEHASFYGYDWDAGATNWVSLSVSRNGKEAWLYFSLERCVPGEEWWDYRCEYSYGYGSIPAGDFSGNLQQGLVLDTDTRSNADFQVVGIEGGRIYVRWEKNGFSESRSSGSSESRWMNSIARTNGTSRSASAGASGSVLSSPLPEFGWGEMGSSRNVSMTFERRTSF